MTEQDDQAGNTDTLLAGKYKTPQDLEKAYLELQRKLGNPAARAPVAAPLGGNAQEFEADASGAVAKKMAEINTALSALQAGDMSATAKLTALGANPRLAQSALGVMQDTQRRYQARLQEAAGGKEDYDALGRWIMEDPKVESFERDAYSEALASGNIQRATDAIRHMTNQHRESTGYSPSQLSRTVIGGAPQRIEAFATMQDVIQAQRDPRCDKGSRSYDPEHAAGVLARIGISECMNPGFSQDVQSGVQGGFVR